MGLRSGWATSMGNRREGWTRALAGLALGKLAVRSPRVEEGVLTCSTWTDSRRSFSLPLYTTC